MKEILSECKTLEDFKQVYQRVGENILPTYYIARLRSFIIIC